MKLYLKISIGLIIMMSCTNRSNEKAEKVDSIEYLSELSQHEKFQQWVDYYKQFDSQFSWEKFEKREIDSLEILPGSVTPIWHPAFEQYYQPLLIFSPDSTRYLDIDSYLWFVIDKNSPNPEIGYSPDQEVNLVIFEDSTVNRIAFRGPSQRVEDAVWLDKQAVALLENNEEGRPMVSIIELNHQTVQYYEFPDSVTTAKGYWNNRVDKAMEMLPELLSLL